MKGADEDSLSTLSVGARPSQVDQARPGTRPRSRHHHAIQACLLAEVVTATLPRAGAQVPFPDSRALLGENSLLRARAQPLQPTHCQGHSSEM